MPRLNEAEIAVIGLGLMGGTMAGHLMADGHTVVGYDPDVERRTEHQDAGGVAAETVAEAAATVGSGIALLSLPNSDIMLEVCAEIATAGSSGLLVVDTTTGVPVDSTTAAAQLAEAGIGYVDATVSGNAAQTKAKDIIFMVGGDDDAHVLRATGLLEPMSRKVYSVGPVSAGSRTKLVVNHILSINRSAVAEGLTVAEKAGLELGPILEVLRDSAAYSKAMDIWGDRMVTADHYPPASRVRQSLKDSRLINAHAEEVGASHAIVGVVLEALTEAAETGLQDADNSSAMELMRRRAGIGRITQ